MYIRSFTTYLTSKFFKYCSHKNVNVSLIKLWRTVASCGFNSILWETEIAEIAEKAWKKIFNLIWSYLKTNIVFWEFQGSMFHGSGFCVTCISHGIGFWQASVASAKLMAISYTAINLLYSSLISFLIQIRWSLLHVTLTLEFIGGRESAHRSWVSQEVRKETFCLFLSTIAFPPKVPPNNP